MDAASGRLDIASREKPVIAVRPTPEVERASNER